MPDLDEAVWKDVEQEPPDKLFGIYGHDLGFVVVRVITPSERDFVVLDLDDPMVADRDAVRIPPEILKNTLGSVERRFTVNHPFLPVQSGDQW